MSKEKTKFTIDPRTKLILLIVVAIFVIGGAVGEKFNLIRKLLACMPLLLLFFSGKKKQSIRFLAIFAIGWVMQVYLAKYFNSFLNFIVLGSAGIITQFLPGMMMGYYAVSTTKVSEFIASMEKMHVTDAITIPLSVMFRFFPTVREEYNSINDAMKMRGVFLGGKHPSKIIEYRLIPLMICSVKIGEELSQAALTRGLGAPVKRTNICTIGFKVTDIILLLFCFSILLYWIINMFI